MPIYEYECNHCHCRFEKKQRFYDEAIAQCPQCERKAKRVLSAVATIFKGSGFYVTDYRKKSEKDKETSSPKDTPSAPAAPPAVEKPKGK